MGARKKNSLDEVGCDLSELISSLRKEYSGTPLLEENCEAEPLSMFRAWLEQAAKVRISEPNIMVLTTVGADHKPSSRAVLIKEINDIGPVFCTNYDSRKSCEIALNKFVAGTIVWSELERQIRLEGVAKRVDRETSEKYFSERPRGSQVAAILSKQSMLAGSREEIDRAYNGLSKDLDGRTINCPENWGGFQIEILRIEFWQGRQNRLHDRIVFERVAGDDLKWKRFRLWP